MVPCPEIMMTSGGLSNSRILSRVSSPSTPGNQTSSNTTSNGVLRSRARHASAFPTDEVEYPSSARMPARESRIPASSSTMRMLCILGGNRCRRRFENNRKFNDETRAHGLVLFYTDRAVMIFDDAVHDSQATSGAAFLGREIWQEEFFLEFAGHAVAGVGNRDLHRIAGRHQCSRNFNLTHHGILRCLGRIVHEIGNGAFDRFAIRHNLR